MTFAPILLTVFIVGYLGIILEFVVRVNKTAVALLLAIGCWMVYFLDPDTATSKSLHLLIVNLGDVSQILFFLLGAMTLVELIDSHKGFDTVVHYLHTHSKRVMLWMIAIISFFLSAILDNLTTTILMISLLRKLVPLKKDRIFISIMVVIAANAGGAWTPIGDVTTTMLWIGDRISTLEVMKEIFIPSLISMLIPLIIYTFMTSGKYTEARKDIRDMELEPGAHLVFFLGIAAFLFVPLFKYLTGMPPFMGMLISLSILWLVTDLMHHKHEQREHLRVPHILTKIDVTSILFFLGILLAVGALQVSGMLDTAAVWLGSTIGNLGIIATIIGIVSAIIDNVPLVAATMGMYNLTDYPINDDLWMMIAYAAGTGGSIFLIGSSAGVALMGMEKISFFQYAKKASLPVLIGYLIGMAFYVMLWLN